ncbi:MAG: pilus assembly protein N-terminal domain-containing protein [Alphaproteobacteria bacterium]|nr:pilus assembly protein N-terminal domain-containing protein [Alphaproteobacteria bacterium]
MPRFTPFRPSRAPALAALLTGLMTVSAPALAAEFLVGVDQARGFRLAEVAAAVVVGNPSIADAYVQDGQQLFILGRSFGATNVIALDREGNEIANVNVAVRSGRVNEVTLHRGVMRETLACAAQCEYVLKPGDHKDHFTTISDQVMKKDQFSTLAAGDR